jgi:hypothetical protein
MRIGILALAALCAVAAPVAAQPSTSKADELFNQGRELLDAGKFKEACAKFQASLDAADALGTRMNLALCMEKRGRVHSALKRFEDNAKRADRENQADSARVAREHADKLRPLVPHLNIKSVAVSGQRITISRPDEPDLEVEGDTSSVPVDPTDPADPADKITITVTAPGYATYTAPARTIAQGANETIVIPELEKVDGGIGTPVPGTTHKSNRRTLAIIVGASGVALMAGGALYARYARNKLDEDCAKPGNVGAVGSGALCEFDAEDHLDNTRSKWWNHLHIYSTTMFFVGVAAVGAGAVLYFTAPKNREQVTVVPTVDGESAGLTVLGHF